MIRENSKGEVLDNTGNVHFVDLVEVGGSANYLFRGALPLIQNPDGTYRFDYDGLTAAINEAGLNAGFPMPPFYRIRDINLLQWRNSDEVPKIITEYNFFNSDPNLGEFMFWDTEGTGLCPFNFPFRNADPNIVEYMAMNLDDWLPDPLVYRTSLLRSYLETDASPTVTYIHCEGGDDRTGELSAAYYMAYMNMSWSQTWERNREIAGRPFGCNNHRAAVWYAMYLFYTKGAPNDFGEPFQCDNNGSMEFVCPEMFTGQDAGQ